MWIVIFLKEFQLMTSTSNDNSLLSYQNTNQSIFDVNGDWTPDLLYNY